MSHNPQHLAKSKNSDERYTPKWIFDKLELSFEIDVASPLEGPKHTPCNRYFSPLEDGLQQKWEGLVWMNPPYSKPKPWIDKFIQHGQGLALLPTSQGQWFLDLWFHPNTYFVPLPYIKFETADGIMDHVAPWRSWLVAIGDEAKQAAKHFERLSRK